MNLREPKNNFLFPATKLISEKLVGEIVNEIFIVLVVKVTLEICQNPLTANEKPKSSEFYSC